MRRVLKTRTFYRWSRKAGLADSALRAAVDEMAAGLIDADLGGRWVFLFGFEKNERDNIDARELASLQSIARVLLEMKQRQVDQAVEAGELVEIE